MREYDYKVTFSDYFGIVHEETFRTYDEHCAKQKCSRYAKNRNAPVDYFISVERV